MVDTFKNRPGVTDPGMVHVAITPSDTVDLETLPKAIYCQEAGTAQIVDAAGTVLPYTMTAGQLLPFRGVRINATDTTGTYYGWIG
jgi:hypothetical protein